MCGLGCGVDVHVGALGVGSWVFVPGFPVVARWRRLRDGFGAFAMRKHTALALRRQCELVRALLPLRRRHAAVWERTLPCHGIGQVGPNNDK